MDSGCILLELFYWWRLHRIYKTGENGVLCERVYFWLS